MKYEYELVTIPNITDERGSLSFVEFGQVLDFTVKRVYWLYDLKQNRGAHAHKELKQFIFCMNGSAKILLDNGHKKNEIILSSKHQGIQIKKPLWRDIIEFHDDPQIIVLASDIYKESDYIRSYEEFKKWMSNS